MSTSSDVNLRNHVYTVENNNPYEIIKMMSQVISDQRKTIRQYELALESMERQKQLFYQQRKKLQNIINQLINKIEMLKQSRSSQSSTSLCSTWKLGLNIAIPKSLITSPNRKFDYKNSTRLFQKFQIQSGLFQNKDILSNASISKKNEQSLSTAQQDYVPTPIRLNANEKSQSSSFINLNNTTLQNFLKKDYTYGSNLLQTFIVIGPQMSDFKKKLSSYKGKEQIVVKSSPLYCHTKFYRQQKVQFLTQIAKRAFPQGCKLKKKKFQHNEQLLNIIQYKPNRLISDDYFVFTLKGDESLLKATAQNPTLKKSFLYISNPNYFLYVVCLKLPDFICIRQQKDYLRKQNQIWVGQKIYAVVTYYPFFAIHTQLLCRTHSIISKIMISKILIQNQNILSWSMTKTVYDVQKNEQVNNTLGYFLTKKPDYNQVCYLFPFYFGTLPQFGFRSQYCVSLYCSPIFFSNFAYQQMLLMLTAIFCQKTLIFLSKVETVATLSALFLINLISPFQYSQPLMLNCDSQKVKQIIFQFPFPMICSIKKTEENIEQILQLFVESNLMRLKQDDAQYIVIDVDSNSILYHHALDKLFSQCVVEPSKAIRHAYLSVNSCESKSFSLPKQLARQNIKINNKHKSEIQKRYEEKKKLVKQYMERIVTNQTKLPTYRKNEKHEQLLKMLTNYIKQFTLDNQNDYQVVHQLENTQKNSRMDIVKAYLLNKNKSKSTIIQQFLKSQMYANYLDGKINN